MSRLQYVVSGSDDFNLYVWRIPEQLPDVPWVGEAHLVLRGHRSIVNQVRCNPANQLMVSSGVEKVIKVMHLFYLMAKIAVLKGDVEIMRKTVQKNFLNVYIHDSAL